MTNAIRVIPAALVAAAFLAVSGAAVAAPGDAYQRPLTSYQGPNAVRDAHPISVGAGQLADGQTTHVSFVDGNPAHIDRLGAYYGN